MSDDSKLNISVEDIRLKISEISKALYHTSISPKELEQYLPYIADNIYFKDPWQSGGGKDKYKLGMKGFHNMLNFSFEEYQVGVLVDTDSGEGRAIIDGRMMLKQFSWIYIYPLRTILRYNFRVRQGEGNEDDAPFQIYFHEEMWSFGDMIENLPVIGKFYDKVFRVAFCYGFLAASYVSTAIAGVLRGPDWA